MSYDQRLADVERERDQLRAEVEAARAELDACREIKLKVITLTDYVSSQPWSIAGRSTIESVIERMKETDAQLAAAQEDRDEHYARAASLVFKLGDVTCADVRRWRDEYKANLTAMQKTLDWAETLLCNAKPLSHCTQDEWDELVRKWRDQKHRAAIDHARSPLPESGKTS